jgi:hypothetical protein
MSESQIIQIHFDTEKHHLLFETFVKTGRGLEKVIEGFSDKLFDSKPDIQIFILTPESGSFLQNLLVSVLTAGVLYIGKPVVDGSIKAITGNSVEYYQSQLEVKTETLIKDLLEPVLSL